MVAPHPVDAPYALSLRNRISDLPMGDDSRLKHRVTTVEAVIGIVSAQVVYGIRAILASFGE